MKILPKLKSRKFLISNSKPIQRLIGDPCAGMGTIFGQGKNHFQIGLKVLLLLFKPVGNFEDKIIALSRLIIDYKTEFKHNNDFQGYTPIDHKTDNRVFKCTVKKWTISIPMPNEIFEKSVTYIR